MATAKTYVPTRPRGKPALRARYALVAAAALVTPRTTDGQDGLRIGIVDFYGARSISTDRLRQVVGLTEGDALPVEKDREALARKLEAVPGVTVARVNAICCHEGAAILFVGIQEHAGKRESFRRSPGSAIRLPDEVVQTHVAFMEAMMKAVSKGNAEDDLSQGHSMMADPDARRYQERAIVHSRSHRKLLGDVLRNSADPEHRAIAAWVLGYAASKREVVDDLLDATRDADSNVRNNAMRSLGAIAEFGALRPSLGIRIRPDRFIDMLDSIDWSDRNKATMVVVALSANRDTAVLSRLRRSALPALVEMARWKSDGHAFGAFMLLGRLVGLSDQQIYESWSKGERETVIARAAAGATRSQ